MRKVLAGFILAIMLISPLTDPAHADGEDSEYGENLEYDPFDKLARGAINLLVSPLEFLQAIEDAYTEDDIAVALPTGLFWGPVKMARRALVGLFEIITFPFPQPTGGYGPIIEDPLFLEEKRIIEEEVEEALKLEEELKIEQDPASYPLDMPDDI